MTFGILCLVDPSRTGCDTDVIAKDLIDDARSCFGMDIICHQKRRRFPPPFRGSGRYVNVVSNNHLGREAVPAWLVGSEVRNTCCGANTPEIFVDGAPSEGRCCVRRGQGKPQRWGRGRFSKVLHGGQPVRSPVDRFRLGPVRCATTLIGLHLYDIINL
jgi:hypothetical protein